MQCIQISKYLKKPIKTNNLKGCSFSFFKKWPIYQLHGEMTLKNYGKFWCLDHCYPLSKVNLSNEYNLYKKTNWIDLRPMYIKDNLIKGKKIDMRLYLLQEIKSNIFMKLIDQEGLNEDLH